MRVLVFAGFAVQLACVRAGEFKCAASTECVRDGVGGNCETNGYCSFPDPDCASGARFGDFSGPFSNQCREGNPPGFFTIGGTVSGLTGTLVLRNNAETQTITGNGAFVFPTALPAGDAYSVSIETAPSGQTCSIANARGTVADADVTDVAVTCADGGDPGILCAPGTFCDASTQICCFDRGTGQGTCISDQAICGLQPIECDNAADCGGAPAVCCARFNQASGNLADVLCKATEADCLSGGGNNVYEIWCDPSLGAAACTTGTCNGATDFTGYTKCQ